MSLLFILSHLSAARKRMSQAFWQRATTLEHVYRSPCPCDRVLLSHVQTSLVIARGEGQCPESLSSEQELRDSMRLSPCRTPVSRAASTKRPTASAVGWTPIPTTGGMGWAAGGGAGSSAATMRPATS